ncbi:MAG: alpha/beta fold hydrolase [Verrucomicrobiota bacterium]
MTVQALSQTIMVHPVSLWENPILPFEQWARKETDRLAQLDTPPRFLLGYSLGARLVMHLLLERPELWAGAVFVSGHPGLEEELHREARAERDEMWATLLGKDPIEFLERWNEQSVFAHDDPREFERQLGILDLHRAAIVEAFRTWSLSSQEQLRPPLISCRVPQLWVAGEFDLKFRELAQNVVRESPSAKMAVVPEAGHRIPLQKPVALAGCIRDFLESRSLG